MKRLLHITLVTTILVSLFPNFTVKAVEGWVDFAVSSFADGNGLQSNPYIIETPEQLSKLAKDVNSGTRYSEIYFKLNADIDLSGYSWTPIGYKGNHFDGVFDGNGKKVSNMTNNLGYNIVAGLFGFINGAVIQNLGIENVNIIGNDYTHFEVGGLCAIADYGSRIINVYTTGNIICGGYGWSMERAGGLIGESGDDVAIIDCKSSCNVTGTYSAGGLIGLNDGKITNCSASGTVETVIPKGSPHDESYAGGLIGLNYGDISNCSASGTVNNYVSGPLSEAGGLIGLGAGDISNCFASGDVYGATYGGGLVSNSCGNISNCSASGSVYNVGIGGGLVGYSSDNIIVNCSSSGSVWVEGEITRNEMPKPDSIGVTAGGLIGYSNNTIISGCYASSSVNCPLGSANVQTGPSKWLKDYYTPYEGAEPEPIYNYASIGRLVGSTYGSDSSNNNFAINPKDPELNKKASVTIMVLDAVNNLPVSNAFVELSNISGVTSTDGTVTLSNIIQGQCTLIVSKQGYTDYISTISVSASQFSKTVFLEKTDIAINNVTVTTPKGETRSLLLNSNFTVDKSDIGNYTINATVKWNEVTGKIYLVGTNSGIKTAFNGNMLNLQIGKVFPENEQFYIEAIQDNSGKKAQKVLHMSVENIAKLFIDGVKKSTLPNVHGLPIDIEFFNGLGFKLETEEIGVACEAKVEDGKVVITLGNSKAVKSSILEKKVNLGLKGKLEVPIETLKNDGEYSFNISALLPECTVADLKQQIYLWGVPTVMKLKVSAEFAAQIGIKGTKKDFSDKVFTASIPCEGTLRAAYGVGFKGFNLCPFGQGTLEAQFNLAPQFNVDPVSITGSFGVEGEIGPFQSDVTFMTLKYPKPTRMFSLNENGLLEETDTPKFTLIGRDYLQENESNVAIRMLAINSIAISNKNNTTILANAFPNTNSKPVIINGNIYMIYQVDDTSRTAVNGLKMVCSQQDGNSWNSPTSISDDGTIDGSFDVASSSTAAFAVWENNKAVLTDTQSNLKSVLQEKEICVSKFDVTNGSWGTPATLTNNSIADYSPVIAVSGNKAVTAWLSNSESDIFGASGVTSINYAFYDNGSWGNVNTIPINGSVGSISVGYNGSTAMVSYDNNGDIYVKNLSNSDAAKNITYNQNNNYGSVLFILNDTYNISYISNDGLNIKTDISNISNLPQTIETGNIAGYNAKLVLNGTKAALSWTETKDDGYNALYASYYDDVAKTWSKKTLVINGQYDVKNFEADMHADGSLVITYLQAQKSQIVNNDDGTTSIIKGRADLCSLTVAPSYNIRIAPNGISYNETYYGQGTVTVFDVTVDVTGEKPISGVQYSVYEGNPENGGNLINTATDARTFNPGETAHLQAFYPPQSTTGRKDIYIKVIPVNQTDFDESDNTQKITIGYGVLSVDEAYFEQDRNNYVLNAIVSNKGGLPVSNGVVSVHEDSADGNVVYTQTISSLSSNECQGIQYTIPADSISFTASVKKYYVAVSPQTPSNDVTIDDGTMLAVINALNDSNQYNAIITDSLPDGNGKIDSTILVTNNTTINHSMEMLVALYDDNNKLISIAKEHVTVYAGSSKTIPCQLKYDVNIKHYTQKVFLWEDVASAEPTSNVSGKAIIIP